jgi:hypothetical protein
MPASVFTVQRLNFILPEFIRIGWITDRARNAWGKRLQRVIRAWGEVESASVTLGVRDVALIKTSAQRKSEIEKSLASQDWMAVLLDTPDRFVKPAEDTANGESNGPAAVHLVIGKEPHISRFHQAWLEKDHEQIGQLLGYPACCRNAFRDHYMTDDSVDPTWIIANRTVSTTDNITQIENTASVFGNVLLRLAGIRAVPHLPCRFDCSATTQFGLRLLDVATQIGFGEEMQWLLEILSWPVEWSALHGIGEIKTPLFRISAQTDATAQKIVVRWMGQGYPQEGTQGLVFPYRTPERAMVTQSPGFQKRLNELPNMELIQLSTTSSS